MSTKLKRIIEELVTEKAPGPTPSFSVFHILLALTLISEKSIGRSRLAEELVLGEGAARTLIERLRHAGLVTTSKAGCSLTNKGLRLWKAYASCVKTAEIEKSDLTFGNYNFAVLVKKGGHIVRSGIEQRDAAVVVGSKGATTLLFSRGHLAFPCTNQNVAKDFPKVTHEITRLLRPEEGDAIVIAGSDDPKKTKYAAMAAAWTLL